jgi:hypothetical protein
MDMTIRFRSRPNRPHFGTISSFPLARFERRSAWTIGPAFLRAYNITESEPTVLRVDKGREKHLEHCVRGEMQERRSAGRGFEHRQHAAVREGLEGDLHGIANPNLGRVHVHHVGDHADAFVEIHFRKHER